MKISQFLLAVCLLIPSISFGQIQVGPASEIASAKTCQRIVTEVVPFTIKEERGTPMSAIDRTQVAGNAYNSTTPGNGLGMVVVERNVTVIVSAGADGCREFKTSLGFIHNTLYIGSELQDSFCAVREVRNHELHHVQLYKNFLEDKLPTRLSEVIPSLQSQLVGLSDVAATQHIQDLLYPILREIMPEQNAFDSDGEYHRLANACNGAIARMARH